MTVRPWHVVTGAHVDEPTYGERMASCRACDSFLPGLQRCGECGCIMLLKARLVDAECPLGRWGKGLLRRRRRKDSPPTS